VSAREELVADDTPLGVDSIEVDGADPWLEDDAKGLCRDLVVCGVSPSMPGCTALGDVALAPGFSGATGLGVVRLLLRGSPGSPPPPVNWK
jgi:hypothetical protein